MRKYHLSLGIALSIALIVAFFWRLDLSALINAFRGASPALLLFGVLHGFLIYVLRGCRWLILLRSLGPISFRTSFWANSTGFGLNVMLPGRLGEVVRAFLVSRERGLPLGQVMATILLERLSDLMVFIPIYVVYVFLIPSLFQGPINNQQRVLLSILMKGTLWLVGVLSIVITLAVFWARKFNHELRADKPLTRFLRKVQVFIHQVGHGTTTITRWSILIKYYLASVGFWLFNMVGIWLHILPYTRTIPWSSPPWINVMLILGVLLPTPGAVGGYHWAFRLAMTEFFGFSSTVASASAIWSHLCAILPAIILTMYAMIHFRLTFKDVVTPPPGEFQENLLPDKEGSNEMSSVHP